MKRFIGTVLCVSVFFVGLGTIIEKAGAKFKSDEKALALIAAARQAIGGDSAIAGVQSLRIVGKTTQKLKLNDNETTVQGETEIALQLPDKLMKTVKIGSGDPNGDGAGTRIVSNQVDVVVVRKDRDGKGIVAGKGEGNGTGAGVEKIIVKRDDGTSEEMAGSERANVIVRKTAPGENFEWKTEGDAKTVIVKDGSVRHGENRENELLRLTLGLLLSAPQGMDVNYTYGGESDIDGVAVNLVVAEFGGSTVKLFLDRGSNLPVAMAYTGSQMPKMFHFTERVAPPADGSKDVIFFRKAEPGMAATVTDKAEFQVRFFDYRGVNGVQLPYRWTTTVNGNPDETFEVTTYEVNPANIAEKFQNQKVMVRTRKADGQ
jgi:hypothetical protein